MGAKLPPSASVFGLNLRAAYAQAMQVWGFMAALGQCDVCGSQYTLKHRHGRYIWQGTRRSHLCVCYEKEHCLASETHLAFGVRQENCPQFLDFTTMCLPGYSRGTIWKEMEQQGADPGRSGWRTYCIINFAQKRITASYAQPPRPHVPHRR